MLFELREERTKRLSNGTTITSEIMVMKSNEKQTSLKYLDLKVGHRRNVNKDEDFSGDRIYSIVRVE